MADRSSWVAIAGVVVSVCSAAVAFEALRQTQEMRAEDLRPFVTVEARSLTDHYPGDTPWVSWPDPANTFLVNNGKSPAFKVHVKCERAELQRHVTWTDPPEISQVSDVIQGHVQPIYCPDRKNGSNLEHTLDGVFYTELGIVSYQDQRGKKFVTPFCWTIAPKKNLPAYVQACDYETGLPALK